MLLALLRQTEMPAGQWRCSSLGDTAQRALLMKRLVSWREMQRRSFTEVLLEYCLATAINKAHTYKLFKGAIKTREYPMQREQAS